MAAGLGFKTFTTGEVLTAADTNGYLMQGVLVFASAAARDAAITSPQEGQFAYLKDTNVTTYYTGSAWANLDTTGMTNPMTTTGDMVYSSSGSTPARLGIGTAGQVLAVSGGVPAWTTTADVTPLTTKGDLFTFSTVDARLGVGSNDQILVADSTASTGLKWATPAAAASGMTLIQRSTFSNVAGTSTTFDGVFTSTYKSYLVSIEAISTTTGGDDAQLQFIASGTTRTASYYGSSIYASYGSVNVANLQTSNASQATLSDVIGEPGGPGRGFIFFNGVGNTSEKPQYQGQFVQVGDMNVFGGGNNSANTYTGFLLKSSSANVTGTVAVYGLATS